VSLLRIIFGLLPLLACLHSVSGQSFVTITDGRSREVIPCAHVCFEEIGGKKQQYCLSDLDGRVPNHVKNLSKIAVSHIGYETVLDTIKPGQNLTITLQPTVLNMKEVVVTAQYSPEKIDKSIYRVNVINTRQIEQKAATNLTDLLKTQLNMRVSQDGVLGSNLSIQGLSGEHIKFLVDGVPLVGRMNGNIDLNQLNLNNVDHVEVIEGPMSVIYGSNALAGVVNIITKENKVARFSSRAEAYAESAGVVNVAGGLSFNRKKHAAGVDVARNFFGGYSDPDTSRYKTWKPRRQYTADGYYAFQTEKTKLKLAGQLFHELLLSKGQRLQPYYENAFDSHFTTIRAMLRGEWTRQMAGAHSLHTMASWSSYRRIKNTYFKDLVTLTETLTKNTEDQDTTGIGSWLARVTFTRSDKNRAWNYQTGLDMNLEEGSGRRISGDYQQIGEYAAFLSMKYDPWKQLSLQPGLRMIHNTKYRAPLVYSVSARWQSLEQLSLRASFSRGFRSPGLKELYLYFVDINHNIQGNPDLKAERSVNLNMTASWMTDKQKKAFRLEASVFYNKIDQIITLAQANTSLYTYINLEHYKTQGVELKIARQWYPFVQAEAGLSRTGRLNALSDGMVNVEKMRYTTDLTGDVTLKYPKKHLSFSAYYKYSGRMPQLYILENTVSEGYISDYHSMDITLTKGFLMNRLKLSAGIKNLFDNTTIPAVGGGSGGAHGSGGASLPVGWGRTYFLKLSCQFNKYS